MDKSENANIIPQPSVLDLATNGYNYSEVIDGYGGRR